MEADWAVEVGPDLPSIDVPWEGFVDLRHDPSAVQALAEVAMHRAMREAIIMLNTPPSPVFTAKCDAWTMARYEIDPDEFAAHAEQARGGFASYIDILRRDPARLASFEFHERWARRLTGRLRNISLPNGRVDLVIRPASANSYSGYALTLYTAGCGADAIAAYASWEAVLHAAVTATISLDSSPSLTGE
jgi:hypothetical protein